MQNVGVDWMDGWMDTPQTVATTRAPAVLKNEWENEGHEFTAFFESN